MVAVVAAIAGQVLGQGGVLAWACVVGVLTARLYGPGDGETRPGPRLLWEVWRRAR